MKVLRRLVVFVFVVDCLVLFCFLFYGLVWFNLLSNSVYYAKHTPHRLGVEPVLMMLAENLDWVSTPDNIKGIKYDFDGPPAVLMFDETDRQVGFFTTSNIFDERGYTFDNEKLSFEFDHNFNIVKVYDNTKAVEEISKEGINEVEVKKHLYKLLRPLINRQSKPLVNLQWLFDYVYRDEFN